MNVKKKYDALCSVLEFLRANEQYGDDWHEEIAVLTELLWDLYDELEEDGSDEG